MSEPNRDSMDYTDKQIELRMNDANSFPHHIIAEGVCFSCAFRKEWLHEKEGNQFHCSAKSIVDCDKWFILEHGHNMN